MELTQAQKEAARFLYKRKKGILELGCGMGKSLTSLCISRGVTIVVCPPSLVPKWQKEISQYKNYFLKKDRNIFILKSTQKNELRRVKPTTLIIDEAHEFMKWKTSQELLRLAKKTEYVYLLTATLLVNRPVDLYWPLKITNVYKGNHRDFAFQFNSGYVGYRNITMLGEPSNIEELNTLKKKVCFSKERRLNLIKEAINLGKCPMKTSRLESYSLFENLVGLSKANNLLVKKNLNRICAKHKKVLIMYFHRAVSNILNKSNFPDINGSMKLSERYATINKFEKSNKSILFLNYKSCGRGVDIPSADACIFIEKNWSSNLDYQAYMRAYRIKRTRPLHLYYLVYKDEKRLAVTKNKNHITLNNMIKGGII